VGKGKRLLTSNLTTVTALLSCSNCAHFPPQRPIWSHIGRTLIVYWHVISAPVPFDLSSFWTLVRLALALIWAWLILFAGEINRREA
jgi:hypothetical protein